MYFNKSLERIIHTGYSNIIIVLFESFLYKFIPVKI